MKIPALLLIGLILISDISFADTRFNSKYPCSNASTRCVSSGVREIDGIMEHRDCWEKEYVKTCAYPSRDNCKLFEHCYAVGNRKCLLQDAYGTCVNMEKEFSCKSWKIVNQDNQTARMDLEEKEGSDSLICRGVPCIDGNCVDKSYMSNGEMMETLSKLHAMSQMSPDKEGNFSLFAGSHSLCSKKALGFSSCCGQDSDDWGKDLGAKCTKDEKTLMEQRNNNLCVYTGKEDKSTGGVKTITKHHYCCFGTILDKVIQVEGRKQLNKNFGNAATSNCSGLTLDEIKRINWDIVDFSEFIADLQLKFAKNKKFPKAAELQSIVQSSESDIREYDSNASFEENSKSGWSNSVQDSGRGQSNVQERRYD